MGSQRVIQDLATEQHTPHPHWTILAWRFFRSQSKQNQNSEFKVFLSWFQSPHFTLSTWIHSCVYPSVQVESESESEVAQSYPTLCDPVDCSPPGSSIHGILQARVLERVAISFSRGSRPRDRTQVSRIAGTLNSEPPGKPLTDTLQLSKYL